MADTGWVSAGTGTSVAYTGSDVAWLNPGNITSSNNNRATADVWGSTPQSEYLRASNFGFSIPSGATIDGIEARIEKSRTSDSSVSDYRVRIVDETGTVGSTDKSAAGSWPTTDTYSVYGSATDLWGETWTATNINDSDFGVVIAAEDEDLSLNAARVDNIQVRVYYTESGLIITPSGVAGAATPGSHTVQVGAVTVSPQGISSGIAVPSPNLALISTVLPTGVAGVSGTGDASVLTAGVVTTTGLASTVVIGALNVLADQDVTASGIASGSALGAVSVLQSLFVQPSGLTGASVVQAPVLSSLNNIQPASVIVNPAVGAASLNITVPVSGVASTVIVSTPVIDQLLQIAATGIDSTVQLGTSTVIISRLGSGFYELATVPANDDDSGAGFFNTAVEPTESDTKGGGFFNTATVPTNDSNSGGGFFNS